MLKSLFITVEAKSGNGGGAGTSQGAANRGAVQALAAFRNQTGGRTPATATRNATGGRGNGGVRRRPAGRRASGTTEQLEFDI